jgi:hypothetical protein
MNLLNNCQKLLKLAYFQIKSPHFEGQNIEIFHRIYRNINILIVIFFSILKHYFQATFSSSLVGI